MAFSLAGFIGGASEKLTQVIEEKEEEILEAKLLKEEREWQDSQYKQRLSLQRDETIATETRARNQQIEDLTGRAAVMFGKDIASTYAKQGMGALEELINFGGTAQNAGLIPKDFLVVNNNNIDESKKTLQNITGSETEAAIPTLDYSRLSREMRMQDNDLDKMLGAVTYDMLKAKDLNDQEGMDAAKAKIKAIIEIAAAKDPDTVDQLFEEPDKLWRAMRTEAGVSLGQTVGEGQELLLDLTGSPWLSDYVNYQAADKMLLSIGSLDKQTTVNARAWATNRKDEAELNLIQYADNVVTQFIASDPIELSKKESGPNGAVIGNENILYGYLKNTTLPSLEKTGKVIKDLVKTKPNDAAVILLQDKNNNMRVAIYTGIPNPELGGAPYLVTER
jgi:hypothetical protein